MKIGKTIKKLRREKDLTQERLAEYLNVSPQAVSRWETDMAYPDITIIPKIANFFGVSSDLLLGIESHKNEEKIQDYLKEHHRLNNLGDRRARYELMKKAASEYPGDFRIIIKYAWTLAEKPFTPPDNSNDINETSSEVEAICLRVLDDCTDDEIRYEAIDILAMLYGMLRDFEKAKNIINRLPGDNQTKPEKLEMLYDSGSPEQILQRQENIQYLGWALRLKISNTAFTQTIPDEKIRLFKKAITIYELIYDNGDYHFYNCDLADLYIWIAGCHIEKFEYDNALQALEKAANHCIAFDSLPEEITHTSLLVNRLVNRRDNSIKGYMGTKSAKELCGLQNELYDPIRNTYQFKAIVEKLNQYSK